MARDAIAFVGALGLKVIDPLGFALGGCVAQEVVLIRPYRPYVVRRLILASTGPQGEKICTPSWTVWSASPHSAMRQAVLRTSSPCSSSAPCRARPRAGTFSGGSPRGRRIATSPPTWPPTWPLATPSSTRCPNGGSPTRPSTRLNRLVGITQPTLVANGDNDVMLPTKQSHLLARHLPNARRSIYPDPRLGFLFQYPAEFGAEGNAFLGT